MARTRDDEDQRSGVPTRTIHDAYREALQARRNYQQAVGGPLEPTAHEQLHDSVANYYETVRPLISTANATEKIWEERELWPTAPKLVDVALCPACGARAPLDDLDEVDVDVNELCPNCENAVVEKDTVPELDEDGKVVYHYVEGLRSVDDVWQQTREQSVTYADALGEHTETRVETQILEADKLQTIARVLDDALRQLDLHARVEDNLPKGELAPDR